MEKPFIYISLNGEVVCLSSYPLYTLRAEALGWPPITHLTGCPDKKLNPTKMLRRKGSDEAVSVMRSRRLWGKWMKIYV